MRQAPQVRLLIAERSIELRDAAEVEAGSEGVEGRACRVQLASRATLLTVHEQRSCEQGPRSRELVRRVGVLPKSCSGLQMLDCATSTPFGRPLDPEVYIT